MSVSDAKQLKELELENARIKRLLAESMLDERSLDKKVVSAPARREDGLWTQRTPLTAHHPALTVTSPLKAETVTWYVPHIFDEVALSFHQHCPLAR